MIIVVMSRLLLAELIFHYPKRRDVLGASGKQLKKTSAQCSLITMHGSSDVFVSSETNKQCKVRIREKRATSITCMGSWAWARPQPHRDTCSKTKARILLSFFCRYRLLRIRVIQYNNKIIIT